MGGGDTISTNVLAAATAGAVVAATLAWHSYSSAKRPKALHVTYQQPERPSAMRYMAALPQSVRHYLSRMGNKPKVPLDILDVAAGDDDTTSSSSTSTTTSPYVEKKEIIHQRLWRIRYQFARNPKMLAALRDFLGMDLLNEKNTSTAAAAIDQSTLEEMQKNQIFIDKIKTLLQETKELDAKATAKKALDAGFVETQDMFVVRLDDDKNSTARASLLLFNPCRMHPEILEYLNTQIGGTVDYIVSGSSSHTNQLPQAAAAFPQAKIICAQAANQKCMAAGMRPAEYIYTNHASLEQVQSILAKRGERIQLFHVQGDTFTQNLVLVAYGHLLDVDLACYGNGHRNLWVSDKDWNTSTSLSVGSTRLVYYASIAQGSVARGYLPDFRVMGCDPTCVFNKLTLDEPDPDGSSCVEMAHSLRSLLTDVRFDVAHNVHSTLDDPVPAEEYKRVVNECWSWLDGKSLLQPQ